MSGRQTRSLATDRFEDPWYRNEIVPPLPNGETLVDYLLSNKHTCMVPGLYPLTEMQIVDDLGWPLQAGGEWPDPERFERFWPEPWLRQCPYGVRELLEPLYEKGFCILERSARLVFLPKKVDYEPPRNEFDVQGYSNYVRDRRFPDHPFKWQALRHVRERTLALKDGAPWVRAAFDRYLPETKRAGALPRWIPGLNRFSYDAAAAYAEGSPPPVTPRGEGGGVTGPGVAFIGGSPEKNRDGADAGKTGAAPGENEKPQAGAEDTQGGHPPGSPGGVRRGGFHRLIVDRADGRAPSVPVASKPVVAVAGFKKARSPKISKPTTTTNGHSADCEQAPEAETAPEPVDECGFVIRNCDLAQDVLARALQRARVGHWPVAFWAVEISGETLSIGVEGQEALDYANETCALRVLEALNEESPALQVRWVVAPRPPSRPLPERWTRAQCLAWLAANGLKGGAPKRDLEKFFADCEQLRIRPADLMHAAREYRRDGHFAEREWPLAVFVQEGVWKPRLPEKVLVAQEAARRVSR